MDNLNLRLSQTYKIIEERENFLITSCENPDGDSVASQLILLQFIRQIKKNSPYRVDILNQRQCPEIYSFLEGSECITPLERWNALGQYEVGIMTDGGPERSGTAKSIYNRSEVKIIIDHHLIGTREKCEIELVSTEVSSTCELLYGFFEIADSSLCLTPALAEMFYVGIIFDTGSFQYDLTRASTHRIAARLLDTGINFSKISERVLLECSPIARRLQGKVLSNVHYEFGGRIAWSQITRSLLRSLGAVPSDMEGLVNMITFTRGVEIAILFYELEDSVWKISLRSRERCNVAKVARTLTPTGGGHKRAAGCTLEGKFRKVKDKVLELATSVISEEFLSP